MCHQVSIIIGQRRILNQEIIEIIRRQLRVRRIQCQTVKNQLRPKICHRGRARSMRPNKFHSQLTYALTAAVAIICSLRIARSFMLDKRVPKKAQKIIMLPLIIIIIRTIGIAVVIKFPFVLNECLHKLFVAMDIFLRVHAIQELIECHLRFQVQAARIKLAIPVQRILTIKSVAFLAVIKWVRVHDMNALRHSDRNETCHLLVGNKLIKLAHKTAHH
mmetsp:Transcript_59064/g.97659  ORF Transcript_59064/g.97659 Transcript_59064/m.97659 type:complete len:218 (+) Transcript_59064:800-1453(+)